MLNKIKRSYFSAVRKIIESSMYVVRHVRLPFIHKKGNYDNVLLAREVLQKGDFILARANGESSNVLIPGFWKHSAIYIGDDQILEAVYPLTKKSWIADLIMHKDNFAVMRMKDVTPEEQDIIVKKALSYEGAPYDVTLEINNPEKAYCSEIQFQCANAARSGYIDLRYRMGFPTFSPQDLYDARSKFDFLLEK